MNKITLSFIVGGALVLGVAGFWLFKGHLLKGQLFKGQLFKGQLGVEQKKVLRVMATSSFVSVFGPGEAIKKEFQKTCHCRVKWLKAQDSTLFVQRLSLRKDGFKTDVVLGLDQISLKKASSTLKWCPLSLDPALFVKPASLFLSSKFVPYNWSPMSFLSRQKPQGLLSLEDLLSPKFKHNISLPSPKNSTVGLQFYYWLWFVFKDKVEGFLNSFKHQLYGLPPSWSTSYALFQRGHVDLSFSYFSSLLYHQQQKQKDFYFLRFREGQPFQVEMAGVPSSCVNCDLAKQFVSFLLKPLVQQILRDKNYMLPVTLSAKAVPLNGDLNEVLNGPLTNLISYKELEGFLEHKKRYLKTWDRLLTNQ